MADQDSLRRLWRYKSDLEQEPDEEKLLEILGRLKRLPVSIAALQETGIGKQVNSLRKHEGVVGDLARKVVTAWKEVVEREVKSSKTRSPSQSPQSERNSSCDEERFEQSENESDADSWNSFSKEEDSSQGSKNSKKTTEPSSNKKRKHSTESIGSVKGHGDKPSRDYKKAERSNMKVEKIKVEPADEYSPAQVKKIKVEKSDDYSRNSETTTLGATNVTVKKEGDKSSFNSNNHSRSSGDHHSRSLGEPHSRSSGNHHSRKSGEHHSRNSGHHHSRSSSEHHSSNSVGHPSSLRAKTNSNNHSVDEKGDKPLEHKKVDRKPKRHSISTSDEDDDSHMAENFQNSSAQISSSSPQKHSSSSLQKPSLSSSHYQSSSSSHKHLSNSLRRSSSSSHNHSSSSSQKPPSSSLHNHSSSSSQKPPSSSSHNHSSSRSQKPSSSSSQKPSSSSSQKPSSSSSLKPSSSSSQKPSSSSSHKPSSSSSQKHSSSSSQKPSSSSSHSHSSNSHNHSSSSHKHSSSSSSSKLYSGSSNHEVPSPALLNHQSTSSSKQRTSSASKPTPQSQQLASDHQQSSTSSTSKRQSELSSTPLPVSNFHKDSDNSEDDDEKLTSSEAPINKSTSSYPKGNSAHDSSQARDKKSAIFDNKPSSSFMREKESYSSQSLKEKSSSSHSSGSHSHKGSSSHSKGSASRRHSEKENPEKGSSSSSHKDSKFNPASSERSGYKVSSSTVYIKSERPSPPPEDGEKYKSSGASKQNSERSSSKVIKVKTESSTHKKKTKQKPLNEEPEPDLFSDAVCIKTEPSSPVHKNKSLKQTATDPSITTNAASPTSSLSHLSSEIKVKSESSNNDYNYSLFKPGHSKTDIKQEKNLAIGSSEEVKNIIPERDKKVKRKKVESPVQDDNKMTFEDFMSFDETLVMKKGKPSQKSSPKNSSSSSSKNSQGHSNKLPDSKFSSSLELPSTSKATFSVPAPSSNVTVTELDILSMLPETQANYKPLRYNPHYHNEEEREPSPVPLVDPDTIGVKSVSRTHVYSGRKHGVSEVKPLYDLCMQVLIDNIDAIDYVGGIPYSILKPVLERCSAQQLYQLEDYNPHFLEDSDELWEVLCQRDFRGSKPAEMESWRELYMRKFEEREVKYQKLKQSMSSSIVKGQAGRKAQLAYVDTVAKPPREVLRKQKQFGTGCIVQTKNNPNIKGSSSGLKAYRPSMLVSAHNPMDDRPRMVKPMPPMMAKSLQMRKNMRR